MIFVQRDQSLNETLAHVGVYRRCSLAPSDHFRSAEIHGNDFCIGAAEIDEEGKGVQANKSSELLPAARISGSLPILTDFWHLWSLGGHDLSINSHQLLVSHGVFNGPVHILAAGQANL